MLTECRFVYCSAKTLSQARNPLKIYLWTANDLFLAHVSQVCSLVGRIRFLWNNGPTCDAGISMFCVGDTGSRVSLRMQHVTGSGIWLCFLLGARPVRFLTCEPMIQEEDQDNKCQQHDGHSLPPWWHFHDLFSFASISYSTVCVDKPCLPFGNTAFCPPQNRELNISLHDARPSRNRAVPCFHKSNTANVRSA